MKKKSWSTSHWSKQISMYLDYHLSMNRDWKEYYVKYDHLINYIDVLQNEPYRKYFERELEKQVQKIKEFYHNQVEQFKRTSEKIEESITGFSSMSTPLPISPLPLTPVPRTPLPNDLIMDAREKSKVKFMYIQLYQSVEALKSFVEINHNAIKDLIAGYEKYSGLKMEIELLEEEPFTLMEYCEVFIYDLKKNYSRNFTHNDLQAAEEDLQPVITSHTESDLFMVFILLGYCFTLLVCWIYLTTIPGHVSGFWIDFPIFRGTLLLNMYFFLYGLTVYFWKRHNINHMYLLELNPRTVTLEEVRACKISSALLACWTTTFFLYYAMKKDFIPQFMIVGMQITASYFPLFCFLAFLTFAFFPLDTFHLSSRLVLAQTIWYLILTPFSYCRFRENFTADVISSMVISLQDFGYMCCFFISGSWNAPGSRDKCKNAENYYYTPFALIPYIWRFLQSLRHVVKNKQWIQILNAGKYSTAIAQVFINGLHSNLDKHQAWGFWRRVWLFAVIIYAVYCFIWDVLMDWGLFEMKWKRKCGICCIPVSFRLRKDRTFPIWYYVVSIIFNFFGRFAWAGTLSYDIISSEFEDILMIVFGAIELVRRANWSIIRLEWAQMSNYLKYRKTIYVPDVILQYRAHEKL